VLKLDRFDRQGGAWGSDTRTPTRLGDEMITLRLARWQGGALHRSVTCYSSCRVPQLLRRMRRRAFR